MNKTGSNSFRLWGTTNPQSIQEHTFHKIILDTVSHRRPKTGGGSSKENIDQRKARQTADWTDFYQPIHGY